jgi:hypothetical protein
MTAVGLRRAVGARRAGAPTARATAAGGAVSAGTAATVSKTSSLAGSLTRGRAATGLRFLAWFGRRCVFLFATVILAPSFEVPGYCRVMICQVGEAAVLYMPRRWDERLY